MVGLRTVEVSNTSDFYSALDGLLERTDAQAICYSRWPARQLLRHLPAHRASLWWLSDHQDPQAIPPAMEDVYGHLSGTSTPEMTVVVIEGLDWMMQRQSEPLLLEFLQKVDGLSRSNHQLVLIPVDSLSFQPTMWVRIRAIAPPMSLGEMHGTHESSTDTTLESGHAVATEEVEFTTPHDGGVLVHLVQLPAQGFSHRMLSKRMLQWKRMGFDLSELEPALAYNDPLRAHELYATVQQHVTKAIDTIRLLGQHQHLFTVTEREKWHFQLMALLDIGEVEGLVAQRIAST